MSTTLKWIPLLDHPRFPSPVLEIRGLVTHPPQLRTQGISSSVSPQQTSSPVLRFNATQPFLSFSFLLEPQ